MSRNYLRPYEVITLDQAERLANQAGAGHHVNHYVACAAAAISDSRRNHVDIFFAPTTAELDHIGMAVEEYIREDIGYDLETQQTVEEIMADYRTWLAA
jgi:hypothetical protein